MHIVFWVTSDCNLCCEYCYEGKSKEKAYMTPETAKKALDMLIKDEDDIMIRFHGGEPLLNIPVIKYIQSYANSKFGRDNIFYSITSNGCVASAEALNLLQEQMDEISISIDGQQDINDLYRKNKAGQGTYHKAIQTALYLKESVPAENLNIRMTYNSVTVSTLSASIMHFLSLGFTNIIPAPDLFDREWSSERLALIQEQMNIVKKHIADSADIHVGGTEKQEVKKRGICDGGVTNFHIAPDGSIYPCTYVVNIPSFCIGNVERGLDAKRIGELSEIYSKPNQECDGCSYYSYCPNSRCKLINWALMGDFFVPSGVSCAVEQAMLRVVGCI